MSLDQSSMRFQGCEECEENEPTVHVAHAPHDLHLCEDCNERFWRGEIRVEGRIR